MSKTGIYIVVPLGLLVLGFMQTKKLRAATDAKPATKTMMPGVKLVFTISGLLLLVWPVMAISSVFLFDNKPRLYTWVTAYGIWSYPLIWAMALYLAKRELKRRCNRPFIVALSIVPFIPVILVVFWHA